MNIFCRSKGDTLNRNLDMLMAEYRLGEEIGGKYFSYMYSCINFTFIFYGAALAMLSAPLGDTDANVRQIIHFALFSYVLPVATYVLGLFYAYNLVAILKQGYFMVKIEKDILELNNRAGFSCQLHAWDTLTLKFPSATLAYGTMLAAYFFLPLACLFFTRYFIYAVFPLPASLICLVKTVLPYAFFLIYFLFLLLLLFYMFRLNSKTNQIRVKVRNQYNIEML